MLIDVWLPAGYELPDGSQYRRPVHAADEWQIVEAGNASRTLIVRDSLYRRWEDAGLIEASDFQSFQYGEIRFHSVSCVGGHVLEPVTMGQSPSTVSEALSFALAMAGTRAVDQQSCLASAIYVEKLSRLLPVATDDPRVTDEIVLGAWLSGGLRLSCKPVQNLARVLTWIDPHQLCRIVKAAGLEGKSEASSGGAQVLHMEDDLAPEDRLAEEQSDLAVQNDALGARRSQIDSGSAFLLPGRTALEQFFNEFVIDIVRHQKRYRALGIGFPLPIVLYGPPGCGKTFAVEKLADFLGWPRFDVDASSIASPYIHETSRKIAEVFETAMKNAPSIIVIDEMDAFLANRDAGSAGGQHHVEEVAEFLRRLPEASRKEVLVIGMTNRLDAIDPAVMRRGRFDHVIEVGPPSEMEIVSLLQSLIATLSHADDIDTNLLAGALHGRALSDVSFVVREGARLTARAGESHLRQLFLLQAADADANGRSTGPNRRIGFV